MGFTLQVLDLLPLKIIILFYVELLIQKKATRQLQQNMTNPDKLSGRKIMVKAIMDLELLITSSL